MGNPPPSGAPWSAAQATTTFPRSAGRPGRRPRAASGATRSRPTRHQGRAPRTAVLVSSRSRNACSVAARPAARDHQPLTVLEQFRLRAVDAQHHRPGRDRNQPVFPSLAVLALALSVLPRDPPECRLRPSEERSRRCASQTSTTSPPRPPSPPSGPPRGTCASRRKLTTPLPPRPPSTWIFARSESIGREVRASAAGAHAGTTRPGRRC